MITQQVSFVDFYNLMTKGKPAPPATNESALNSPMFGTERSPSVAANAGDLGGAKSFASRV